MLPTGHNARVYLQPLHTPPQEKYNIRIKGEGEPSSGGGGKPAAGSQGVLVGS